MTPATAGIGHDVALGGDGNDWIHTGPGEDLANGNAGDDRIFLGDNFTATTARRRPRRRACSRTTASTPVGAASATTTSGAATAPTTATSGRASWREVPGLFPTSDPETWYQVAGAGPTAGFPPPAPQELSHNGVNYAHGNDNFGYKDYHYGGWDQDTLQANVGDNGPHIGDRMLDWGGSYNGYYLCPSTYGDWVSTRALAPGLISFLQQMSQGDGATTTATAGTSGFRETAIVFSNEVRRTTRSRSTPTRPPTSPAGPVQRLREIRSLRAGGHARPGRRNRLLRRRRQGLRRRVDRRRRRLPVPRRRARRRPKAAPSGAAGRSEPLGRAGGCGVQAVAGTDRRGRLRRPNAAGLERWLGDMLPLVRKQVARSRRSSRPSRQRRPAERSSSSRASTKLERSLIPYRAAITAGNPAAIQRQLWRMRTPRAPTTRGYAVSLDVTECGGYSSG